MKKYYAGIDLGGTFVKCAIIDSDGLVLSKDKIPTGKERSYSEIIKDMSQLVISMQEKLGVKVSAIGIGSPGSIDSANGIVIYNNNIGWKNVDLSAEMRKYVDVPVFVANDANVAALGEQFYGSGKSYKNIIFITLGTGVGGGIIIDGELFEGYKSVGAEIGHAVIKMGGEICSCGRKGCFEAYASATALIRQTKKAMLKDKDSYLWKLVDGNIDKVDGKTAFDGLRAGDKTAKKVVNTYVKYLSEGVLNLCNEFRPEAVVLGGGICAEGELLFKPLKKLVLKHIYGGVSYAPIEILTATLGNDAGFYGAVRYAVMRLESL